MSNAEAGFSATVKDSRNNLLTIRGDSHQDFKQNLSDALGGPNAEAFLSDFTAAFTGVQSTSQAAATVTATLGGNVIPLPQPGSVVAQPAGPPPMSADGGSCIHGPRVYKDTQTAKGPWRRWECAIPWSREAVGRCKAVNV